MTSPDRDAAAEFDAFFESTWQPVLLQTFAACGDLAVARDAVERAFVDAWHHWSRATWQGPDTYVRASALRRAGWRTRARAFHRSQRVTRDQRATLKALDGLTLPARRAVALASLSTLDVSRIAHEIGETEDRTTALVAAGREGVATTLGVPTEMVATRLHGLAGAARSAQRPAPATLRGRGVRRRRAWLGGGVVAAVMLTVLGGFYVHTDDGPVEKLPPAIGPEVTASLLLRTSDLASLGNPATWTIQPNGARSTFCQQSRSADPNGLRAYLRSFRSTGSVPRRATQAIELSRTERQARAAYTTVLGWFSACSQNQLQVLTSNKVSGLGDTAMVMRLRSGTSATSSPATDDRLSSYAVGIARTGHILTWTAVTSANNQAPSTQAVLATLADSVTRACRSKAAGTCTDKPVVQQDSILAAGEQPGMLAVGDLPAVPGVSRPWRGTDAQPTTVNAAATTCDRTDFATSGSATTLSRTFLVPGASVPTRFGISETLGGFQTPTQAKGLVTQVVDRLSTCQDRDPGAKVGPSAMQAKGPRGSSWYLWRVTSDISAKRSVTFWMGIARYGVNVVQVSFVPGSDDQDLSQPAFTALVERSRDRLFELSGTGQ